jgi:sulfur carrier protein
MVSLKVNGESHECPESTTVLGLLKRLSFPPQLVVIEYNRDILHRQNWAKTEVKAGDIFEIVTVVGGG